MNAQSPNVALLAIIRHQWASNQDIMVLANCGVNKAIEIRKAIENQILAEGKLLPPNKQVPMKRVLDMLEIDEARVIKMSKLEKEEYGL